MPGLIWSQSSINLIPGGGDGSEPSYQAGVDTLIVDQNFESYNHPDDSASGGIRGAFGGSRNDQYISLVTGLSAPNGSKAARWSYGINFGYDILFGPDNFESSNPLFTGYTEVFLTFWVRFSAGADPADHEFNGIKGVFWWHGTFDGGRYEAAFNRADNRTNALPTRWLKFLNQSNAITGKTVWKTADGWAPLLSDYADGVTWHRVTMHMRAGPAQTNRGAKIWLNGTLIYDDQGVDVVTGFESGYEGYTYTTAIGGVQFWANFVNDTSARANDFTIDMDRVLIWRP